MPRDPLSAAVPFTVGSMGIATFAGMDVLMKGLSIELGAYNAMFWRTSISLPIALTLFLGMKTRWPPGSGIAQGEDQRQIDSGICHWFFGCPDYY